MKFEKRRLQKSGFWDKFHYCKHHYSHNFYHHSVLFTEFSQIIKVVEKKLYPADCMQGMGGANLGNPKKKCKLFLQEDFSEFWYQFLMILFSYIYNIYNIKLRVSFLKLPWVALWQKQKCKHFFGWLVINS